MKIKKINEGQCHNCRKTHGYGENPPSKRYGESNTMYSLDIQSLRIRMCGDCLKTMKALINANC